MIDKITAKELRMLFDFDAYPNLRHLIIRDRDYLVPAKQWIKEELFPFVEYSELFCRYKKNFDCDDFSTGFRFHASVCNGQRDGDTPEGIAIAEVSYTRDSGRRHAINLAVVGFQKEIRFIEPQTPGWTNLSTAEIASITTIIF